MSQQDTDESKPKVDTPQQRKLMKAVTWVHDKAVGFSVWIKNRGLFGSIFTWASLAVILLVCVIAMLIWINHMWFSNEDVNVATIVQPALGIVAGVGAVAYLVIAYRKQNNAEAGIIDQRMVTAIDQLASESPQKRIAGVYALAEISDTYKGEYRQRVVDILCSYLRTDRHGKHTQEIIDYVENRVSKSGKSDMENAKPNTESKETKPQKIMSPDAPVESTIFRVMRERLLKNRSDLVKDIQKKTTDQLWCDCRFDFHGAVFVEDIDLSKASFDSDVIFDGAYFVAKVDMSYLFCKLSKWLQINNESRQIVNEVRFDKVIFGEVSFSNADLDFPSFKYVRFDKVDFANASFRKPSFEDARFKNISAAYVDIYGGSNFDGVIFESGEIPEEFAKYMTEDQKDYATNPARWPKEED